MPDEPVPAQPSAVPVQPSTSGPTPTGYVRQANGGFLWQPPAPEELQDQFTQYQVLELVGRGGMGAVYKAWQTNLKRPVAIKILPRDLNEADPTFVERFKQEAVTMASLSHPAIISVHDAGETPSGLLYFVMDYVEGTDVFQMLLEQRHLKPKHALLITAHVCDALQYAHNHGVMHRDIKPANIMVDAEGYVRVADFGLAKSLLGSAGLTQVDLGVGTPDYAAPEAFTVGLTPDHRADLYSVGVVLYQMLTGILPKGNFKRPSELVPGVDRRFDAIVLRSMEPNPPQRYQNATEIRQALDQILEAPVIEAGGQSSPAIPKKELSTTRGKKSADAKKSALVPVLVGLAALVVVVAGIFLVAERPNRSDDHDTKPSAPLGGAATLATPVTQPSVPVSPKEAPVAVAQPSDPTPPKDPLLAVGQSGIPMTSSPEKHAEPKVPANPEASDVPPATTPEKVASNRPVIPRAALKPKAETPSFTSPNRSAHSPTSADEKPGPAFPPGRWVKLFTKFEDLPENLRQPESGVTFEEGWIVSSKGHKLALKTPKELGSNCAIRARIIRGATTEDPGGIVLRRINSDARYAWGLYAESLGCNLLQDHQSSLPLLRVKPSVLPKPGEEYTLEFAAVGDRLICRFNESVVRMVSDKTLPAGQSWISGAEPIRDIEVINLDGISETEALRIIGVDEKGNDLRALAAKKEKEDAEKAKQADAISAIPELKQRHEQFLKLQSEKVIGPFEADVAKLNTGYLGALDRTIEDEKKAGNLQGVLAMEAEKKLIADKEPIPENDEKTPASLKKLRAVYRDSLAKAETKKTAELKKLADSLTVSLKQLESDLTRQNRVADAKAVLEYREGLAQGGGQAAAINTAAPKALGGTRRDPALAAATKDKPFENSLGMKFVPVKGTDVLFCIHETRWKDYAAYAKENPGIDAKWKDQRVRGFAITDRPQEHPVVYASWEDAQEFCKWLSEKEKKIYRLSTDREWSVAIGLGRKERWHQGDPPVQIKGDPDEFPWGRQWPPSKGTGNYSDASCKLKAPETSAQYIEQYDDGFPTTAPVMTFKSNEFGLYDMGGNVWEWVEDWWSEAKKDRVLRGGSWGDYSRNALLSSYRRLQTPEIRFYCFGFRVVLDLSAPPAPVPVSTSAAPKPVQKPQAGASTATTSVVSQATKEKPFENSLGMKFVPVKGTDVLFCIHETRWKDYAEYSKENAGIVADWKNQKQLGFTVTERPEDHPVVYVSWEDTQGFCKWLSEKEKKTYRLPTDREWSVAVGLGRKEKWRKGDLPVNIKGDPDEFPWGRQYPPPKGAGNYSDETANAKTPNPSGQYIDHYDGYPTTAPVLSFPPNDFGLYDMGGNVWEWVEDWWNDAKTERVLRGCSWRAHVRGNLLSSYRGQHPPSSRYGDNGFRLVVVLAGG